MTLLRVGTPPIPSRPAARHGATLVELTFAMTILSGAFVAVFGVLNCIADGMHSERVQADQYTRATGTLYDLVSELREVAAYSPNFYIEQNPLKPPRITFDKIDSVDSVTGKMIWGSKITYRLVAAPDSDLSGEANRNGIVAGRVVREEVASSGTTLSVIEDRVPFQYLQNGVATWGFNLTVDGSVLQVTLSHYGNTGVQLGDDSKTANHPENHAVSNGPAVIVSDSSTNGATSTSSHGTYSVFTVSGVYYLRNPQEIIPVQ